ncbi:unnamed protein product [Dicrocoelium dendriticum]|nr:unnamed protein product [Dicrocoelium dendriticum]
MFACHLFPTVTFIVTIVTAQYTQTLHDFENFGSLMDESVAAGDPQIPLESPHYDTYGQHFSEYDHELVTGSSEEARYFKQLAPEEAKERLGRLFDKMDKNQDEKLDKEELTDWIVRSFERLDLESSKEKLKDHDANQDGVVTWSEYTSRVYGYTKEELDQLMTDASNETKEFIRSMEEEKVKFDSADTDQNGSLNVTEYAAFEHPHNYRHMSPYEIIHTLRDFDKNGDGLISQEEYLADEKMHADAFVLEKENFKRYDKNGDGFLDHEEMKDWVTPGFYRTATDETEHLFMETDKDKNELLTKEEVLSIHELWVGSQATDFGRHLENDMKDEL